MTLLAEFRGLLADYLLWWAFKLDPDRFLPTAVDGSARMCWPHGKRKR
jgi:hypothetical protein